MSKTAHTYQLIVKQQQNTCSIVFLYVCQLLYVFVHCAFSPSNMQICYSVMSLVTEITNKFSEVFTRVEVWQAGIFKEYLRVFHRLPLYP